MKSELQVLAEGVEFNQSTVDGRISAKGAPNVDLRSAVAERIEMVRARLAGGPSKDGKARWGICDTCGGAMRSYRAGMCLLCDCALQKIQDEKRPKNG